jgi:5-methylcytosine-specific restriction endonuclease McrA|tara:strand:- start:2217 stop:2687 length:471 start_codon:yes stop_codon:yes gene_type:complete
LTPQDAISSREETVKMDCDCDCGATEGTVSPAGPHYRLDCDNGHYIKFVSKKELGIAQRSVRSHPDIAPNIHYKVMERAGGMCELCGSHSDEFPLHVDHILSIYDAKNMDIEIRIYESMDNLMALCEECNLGKGRTSLSPRVYAALLNRRADRNAL